MIKQANTPPYRNEVHSSITAIRHFPLRRRNRIEQLKHGPHVGMIQQQLRRIQIAKLEALCSSSKIGLVLLLQ